MQSRFAVTRVRPAHRDHLRVVPRASELLLMEWPRGESEPTRYWLSTLPPGTALADLVRLAKIRWRIEQDFQELKDEIGLDHYQGRGWRGFHYHGALCIAAYAFLAAERARLPPSTSCLPAPRSPTQRLSPARRRRCALNVTSPVRSLPFESARRACLPQRCAPAPGVVATRAHKDFLRRDSTRLISVMTALSGWAAGSSSPKARPRNFSKLQTSGQENLGITLLANSSSSSMTSSFCRYPWPI
jgi:hypothetical protein